MRHRVYKVMMFMILSGKRSWLVPGMSHGPTTFIQEDFLKTIYGKKKRKPQTHFKCRIVENYGLTPVTIWQIQRWVLRLINMYVQQKGKLLRKFSRFLYWSLIIKTMFIVRVLNGGWIWWRKAESSRSLTD